MREILRTTDMVVLSFATSLLGRAGLAVTSADEHISVLEGSIGAFPRRLLVLDEDWTEAQQVLEDGGLAAWLITP